MSKYNNTGKCEPSPTSFTQPAQHKPEARKLGFLTGELVVPSDFDEMGREQIQLMFEGHK